MNGAETSYAGISARAVAFVGDLLLAQALTVGAALVVGLVGALVNLAFNTLTQALAAVGYTLVVGAYFAFFWTVTGQTPAMRLMHLRVAGPDGRPPGIARSLVRLIGLALALIPLGAGFLTILVDDRRRGLHDLLARTVVLFTP